jgi:hypothetical protein
MSEVLETEKEINLQLYEATRLVLDQFEVFLDDPQVRRSFVTGSTITGTIVNVLMDPVLEAIALKIIEKDALIKHTLEEETLAQLKEELFFYTDLFYSVVTYILDLAELRRNDIGNSVQWLTLFATMQALMEGLANIPELENLRNELRNRSDNYPEKPELQKQIALMVPTGPTESCIYTINPPKALHEYQDGNILASVPGGTPPPTIAGLPPGIVLDAADGTLLVENAEALVKGTYTLFIETTDGTGGITQNTVTLPIGTSAEAQYTIFPSKKIDQYTTGAPLAVVSDADGEIVSAKVNGDDTGGEILPPGVSVDPVNGTIIVSNQRLLLPGIYYLSITTVDSKGGETTHKLILTFEADLEAVYKVNAPGDLKGYRNEQVLATVSDPDGAVISAVLTTLPPGIGIDPASGDIVVADHTQVREGVYKFNIQHVGLDGLPKVCSVELTIGNNVSQYNYVTSAADKIHNYVAGQVLAQLNIQPPELDYVTLASGKLPAGTALSEVDGTIAVSDPVLLVAGIYQVKILLKPLTGEAKIHDLTLEIEPDYKAVYRVPFKKDINDYTDNEIIAEAFDEDTIVLAEIVEGNLPPGTVFDDFSGQISISNTAELVPGKYVLKINTTDASNGQTLSRIALYFNGTDVEAVYTIAEPKAVDSYKPGDVLATVTDNNFGNYGIVKAVVSKGALPLGTQLDPVTGTITVSEFTKGGLHSGVFDQIFIKTTDGNGGITEQEITLVFLPDIKVTLEVFPAKASTAYVVGELLTELSAPGIDDIKSVVLSSGDLPPGTKINSINGQISVYDTALLEPGSWPVTLLVTDKNGGQTDFFALLQFIEDLPAEWSVIAPTQISFLSNGSILATPTDPNGPITGAVLLSGSLPPGAVMSALTGVITVNNSTALAAGIYTPEIRTTDGVGGLTTQVVTITLLNNDQEAIYTILPAKNVDAYVLDEPLATASDPNGNIVNAEVIAGNIPPGSSVGLNGKVKVETPSALVPGVSSATIRTTDTLGYTTDSVVIIEILSDSEAEYTVSPPVNYDTIVNGTLLASVTDPDDDIITAILIGGSLPAGTTLYVDEASTGGTLWNVGDIVVTDAAAIVPGIYSGIQIRTTDDTGGRTEFNLEIEISPDNDAVYVVHLARDLHSYRNDDNLAYPVDPDGPVVSATLTSGSLHSGVAFDTGSGIFIVSSRLEMIGGYKSIGLETTDSTGGLTAQVIGIEMKIYPDRRNRAQQNLFVKRFTLRLDEFEALFEDRLTPDLVENRAFVDNAKVIADEILVSLENPVTENQFWTGTQEDYIKMSFLAISAPVKDGILATLAVIGGGGTPEEMAAAQRDLLLRTAIYNEIFVSMIGITAYRSTDISSVDTSTLQTMFDDLEAQLTEVFDVPELAFMLENITVIASATNPLHVNLITRLNELAT